MTALGGILVATGGAIVKLVVSLVALYFFLVDGHKLVAWLEANAPLAPGQFRELVGEFRRTAVSVLVATVATAGIQAGAALIGFLLAGAPGPLFLATVTFLVALVPAVGGTVVVLAVALLQYATGHEVAAGFLAVWALGVVSMVDTLARPYLLRAAWRCPSASSSSPCSAAWPPSAWWACCSGRWWSPSSSPRSASGGATSRSGTTVSGQGAARRRGPGRRARRRQLPR